jgi:protocatechuate 3,4-dioxygenase beta subunit
MGNRTDACDRRSGWHRWPNVLLLEAALLGAIAPWTTAQAPSRGPVAGPDVVALTGRVVSDGTGDPIRNARVTLSPESLNVPVVLTDADGAFRLVAPAGRFAVVASKTGYARAEVTPPPSGQPIDVRLKKGAAVTGKIVDERGDPIIGLNVAALKRAASGKPPVTIATTETDDRGEYRLAGLAGGSVVVRITTFGGSVVVRITTFGAAGPIVNPSANHAVPGTMYYPGTTSIDEAQAMRLQPGDERTGMDVVVPASQLAGLPDALFANRFLPRPESPRRFAGAQRSTRSATAAVRGRVLNIDGTPIAFARVFLFAPLRPDSKMTISDESGRFEFGGVAAGTSLLSVFKSGYAQVESGRALEPFPIGRAVTSPTPNDFQAGHRLEVAEDGTSNVDLQMARWGTLSGTIRDEYGDPMQGVSVDVLRVQYSAGRRRLVSAGDARLTDDLGRYRLHGLAPGRYIVTAAVGQLSSDDLPGYGRSYFPGTANAGEAQYVSIDLAQDIDSVDFAMSRSHTARVAGIVLSPAGEPSMPGTLTLAPAQRSSTVTSVAVGARIAPDGSFVFPNVPPGQYVIQASRGRLNSHTEGAFGAVSISVDSADLSGVIVRTSSGSAVTGRFWFERENATTAFKAADFELTAIPVDIDVSPPNNPASADIHADWTFEMSGLNGPRRLQLVRTPPGLALKEIRVNGADITDRPIDLGTRAQSLANVDVVLTDRVAGLTGLVIDERTRPVAGAAVVVFATDRERWYPASRYLREAAAGSDGAFTLTGLPPGSYHVSAVTGIPSGGEDAWQDPEFLDAILPGAATIVIVDGQQTVVTLHASDVRTR